MSKITSEEALELEELDSMVHSRAWRVYVRNMLIQHKQYLIEQTHTKLKNHKDREAGELLACSVEVDKIKDLITNRILKLKDLTKQGV